MFMLDSRELPDAMEASMSWDHLTPDPSPAAVDDEVKGSHYTPEHKPCFNFEPSGPSPINNLDDDTFLKCYDLKAIDGMKTNVRFSANLNPAITIDSEQSLNVTSKYGSNFSRNAYSRSNLLQLPHDTCNNFDNTRRRSDVPISRTNIVDKISKFNQFATSMTSAMSEGTLCTLPLLSTGPSTLDESLKPVSGSLPTEDEFLSDMTPKFGVRLKRVLSMNYNEGL